MAWRAHLIDTRDTATPIGVVLFLKALATQKLLSASSSQKLLDIMCKTVTGSDRLMAGVPKGWTVAHKTGAGMTWQGMNAATNDVGILYAPDGRKMAVALFVAESRRSKEERALVIAKVARLMN